ncbi:MAG: TonB-dependent receptor [Sphingobacteriales bacterium]|nr:TonB-dependent receptor [Sphingobacteriales bacterium]
MYSAVQAQSITGKLADAGDKKPLKGASISLKSVKDSAKIFNTISDADGKFAFGDVQGYSSFYLQISFVGYTNYRQQVTVKKDSAVTNLGILLIPQKTRELETVTVVAKTPPVQQKGDTIQYNASQFKVNPDANAEDLIKKMPGVTVDKSGTVTAHGDQVKKVTIDGKEFFGDDVTAALRNLPSEIIDKIQVFDRLSDQAQFTGFDDGNSVKSINIVTKTGMRNGQFGRIYTGAGTDGRYSAGGNASFFKGDQRISIVGLFNNINQQNFSSQDLLGISSSGSGNRGGGNFRGGGAGGRGGGGNFGGGFGGTDNFLVGQQTGINKTNAAGINFADQWGKKLQVQGSYFFNNSNTNNDQQIKSQTILSSTKSQFSNQTTNSLSNNYNNRINLRLEYKIDSFNSLIITPSLNFQNNKTITSSDAQTFYGANDTTYTYNSNNLAKRNGYNLRNNILFRHAFAKRGRTFSVNLGTTFNRNDGDSYINADYRFFTLNIPEDSLQNQYTNSRTNGYTLSSSFNYTEPVGKSGQFQISYSPSYTKNKADQKTFSYDAGNGKYTSFDTSLSNLFDNTTVTHNAGVSYRIGNRDNQFMVGVNLQHSELKSDRIFPNNTNVDQSFTNVLPNLMWRKKLSAKSNIRVFYRASTNFPSVTQLQDVVNISNPLRVSSGNPDLKQQYTNFLSGRYTFTNTNKGQSFFANIFLQATGNYISNATYIAGADSTIQKGIVLKQGSQLSKPVNLNGYKSLRSFFTYSQPVKFIKSNINLNAGFSYSRLPGLINYTKSITDNYTYTTGIGITSNISQYIDYNLSYTANFNNATSSVAAGTDNNYVNQVAGLQLNLLSKKGWFLQNDVNYETYSGLSSGYNQRYWLWNAAAGKKLFKKQTGEIKLSVFDLLKQNQSITRTVTENYIEDAINNVLRQYFMLTFTYNLKNFGTPKASANRFGGNGVRPNF